MTEKRFTIKPQDDYWAVVDNYNTICIINSIHTKIEAIWLCDFMNEQQATIDKQKIIIEERDAANERLNRFLIEIGLEKEYIKWEFKKRCVE